ncbi:hypothetical protein [[Ruminococcus] lactaris]|uniref:hypothetical protein n=1 Tax=[Ruminococcus] lactaris TaxID=46228 RepID=UPI0026DB1713|nr:hypothetical protein [[Ruminococcus] lactaris]
MKNKEKFAKEIVEIACDRGSVAVSKAIGEPVYCKEINCRDCLLNNNGCSNALRRWAESEYIEKPVISKKDRAFLDYLNVNIYYIARDMGGDLYVYIGKPLKFIDCWESSECEANKSLRMFNTDFPMVKWEDSEPWLIEDLKKLEVVEDYD